MLITPRWAGRSCPERYLHSIGMESLNVKFGQASSQTLHHPRSDRLLAAKSSVGNLDGVLNKTWILIRATELCTLLVPIGSHGANG